MKLDLTIIKDLLEAIEESDCYPDPLIHTERRSQINLLNPDVSQREIAYHLERMIEANFIKGRIRRDRAGVLFLIDGLTIDGHEFLNNARCKTAWKTLRDKLEKFGTSFSLEVAKVLLAETVKAAMLAAL